VESFLWELHPPLVFRIPYFLKLFQSENDFSYFIANEFGVKENIEQVNKQRIDSLYQVLNKDKKNPNP
jgi:hypothetical protein